MSQPLLDVFEINAMFKQGSGITVTKHVTAYMFGYISAFQHCSQHFGRPVCALGFAAFLLKEIFVRMIDMHVSCNDLLHILGKGHIPVLAAFSLTDMDHRTAEVQIIGAQMQQLGLSHSGIVQQTQQGLFA